MRHLGPSADAYAAALNACYAGGQYERAEQLKVRPLSNSVECIRRVDPLIISFPLKSTVGRSVELVQFFHATDFLEMLER